MGINPKKKISLGYHDNLIEIFSESVEEEEDNDKKNNREYVIEKISNNEFTNDANEFYESITKSNKHKEMLTDYMKDNNLDYDEKKLERIRNDVAILTLGLKMRYNRPRPEQLGPMLGYDIKSMKTETDDTPSYPSGHTAQAWTMAYYLADLHPDHKDALFDMAQKVEDSRIIRGAHYPSDNIEAKNIAQKYYFPNIKE